MMSFETLTEIISKCFSFLQNSPFDGIDFIWHGGEPLIAGLPFFKEAMRLQELYSGKTRYGNTVQTNGSLITQDWGSFFREHNFAVSVSLDGPKEIHDSVRMFPNGKGTFDKVMDGIKILKDSGNNFGTILVLSKANKDHTRIIFDFLSHEKFRFHIVPLTKQGDARENFDELGLSPTEYADPWIQLYENWINAGDEQYVYCKEFVNKSASILNTNSYNDCVGMKQCSKNLISVDFAGFVYPCGTFSSKNSLSYGNIHEHELSTLLDSPTARKMCNRLEDKVCKKCPWEKICHGGCCSRAYNFFGTIDRRDYYCPSFKKIYAHVEKRLREKMGSGGASYK